MRPPRRGQRAASSLPERVVHRKRHRVAPDVAEVQQRPLRLRPQYRSAARRCPHRVRLPRRPLAPIPPANPHHRLIAHEITSHHRRPSRLLPRRSDGQRSRPGPATVRGCAAAPVPRPAARPDGAAISPRNGGPATARRAKQRCTKAGQIRYRKSRPHFIVGTSAPGSGAKYHDLETSRVPAARRDVPRPRRRQRPDGRQPSSPHTGYSVRTWCRAELAVGRRSGRENATRAQQEAPTQEHASTRVGEHQ